MAMMALLESPQVKVLGITIVTGGRLARRRDAAHLAHVGADRPRRRSRGAWRGVSAGSFAKRDPPRRIRHGRPVYMGAWRETQAVTAADATQGSAERPKPQGPYEIPHLLEGQPTIKAIDEDAAHFLIRQVRAHPHEVTIYAAGPLTNIALAIAIDPEFASLTKGIAMMGTSLNPQTDDPAFAINPRYEFNVWFDPEAAHIVLHADWPRIDVTTADVSLKAPFTQQMLDAISKSNTPGARYIAAWSQERYFMWDELAALAWVDPSLITKEKKLYMDVDLSHGLSYGDVFTWAEDRSRPPGSACARADRPRSAQVSEDVCGRDDRGGAVGFIEAGTPAMFIFLPCVK